MTLPKDDFGFPDPSVLDRQALVDVVALIQSVLWGGVDRRAEPDKEWDSGTIEEVADVLEHHGLKP